MAGPIEMIVNATKIPHPYYPLEVEIAGYLANESSVPTLLGVFFALCGVLMAFTYFVAKAIQPRLSRGELWTIMWFTVSGTIHFVFEGYYARHSSNMGGLQSLMGQMWKEYAMSDSRYLTQDAFVLCMESVTAAFWGPGCWIIAFLIVYRHPLRFPLQLIVSLGQVYGLVLYYATSMYDHYVLGITYFRPEAYYFWGYYFALNFVWMVIPGYLIYEAVVESTNAHAKVARMSQGKKAQ